MLLNDRQIKSLCVDSDDGVYWTCLGIKHSRCIAHDAPMITPFTPKQIREPDYSVVPGGIKKIISHGLTTAGYDIMLEPFYKKFSNHKGTIIDVLNFDEECLIDEVGPSVIIPPHSYILGYSVEEFNLPRQVMGRCVGKSTLARCGILVNVTPLEAGWRGRLTLEIANSTPCPIKIYANMGIAQIQFEAIDDPEVSYGDRNGKYQDQEARPVVARL